VFSKMTAAVAWVLAGALTAWAGGGDFMANRHYERAIESWDSDPSKALASLEKALGVLDVSDGLKAGILLSKGRLLVAKLGDPAAAEPVFDEVLSLVPTKRHKDRWEVLGRAIAQAEGDPRYEERLPSLKNEYADLSNQLNFKAQAMVAKANLCYAERGEVERALRIYLGANYTWESAMTCDVASQFCYRVSREAERPQELQRDLLQRAEEFSLESLRLVPLQVADEAERLGLIARYLLQLAIVYRARGAVVTSDMLAAIIDPTLLGPESLYQQSVFAAVRGDDEGARTLMKMFFDDTRPTKESRNDLRKFVRSEPDLQHLVELDSWKYLVTDE
jgi:tetratricopeptide (TPR) repeat protein